MSGRIGGGRFGLRAGATAAALCLALMPTTPLAAQSEKPWWDRAEIHGLMFGDYYGVVRHHDGEVDGANGFWARRIYLTFDYEIDEDLDFRLRFEGNSPGDFRSEESIDPFVKDLWIRWSFAEDHRAVVGITSTPTWDFVESFWGYRHLEKTALDLQKFGSSRDFAVGLQGRLDGAGRLRYSLLFGNGSGTSAEVNEGKKVYGSLRYQHPSGFVVEAYGDFEARPGDSDRATYQGFLGWESERVRAGLLGARQHREQGPEADLDLDLVSAFTVVEAHDQLHLVLRADRLFDPNPAADRITYFQMSPQAESVFLLAGIDVELRHRFHVIPNLEAVLYDDVGPAENPSDDVFLKTTFSATF